MATTGLSAQWIVDPSAVERLRRIGSGGFGTVYIGTWKRLSVALKYVQQNKVPLLDAKVVVREVEMLAKLRHPHIIEFFGAHIDGPEPFIVMAYHRHGDARSYVEENPGCNRANILYGVILGLVYLHSLKITHGDIKAANILIDDSFKAILCDLGLARIKAVTSTRTSAGDEDILAGSRGWMAPELLLGKRIRLACDIYSLGITIHEIYTLEFPFATVGLAQLWEVVAKENIRPDRPIEDDLDDDGRMILIPDKIWNLSEQCWKDRSRRTAHSR